MVTAHASQDSPDTGTSDTGRSDTDVLKDVCDDLRKEVDALRSTYDNAKAAHDAEVEQATKNEMSGPIEDMILESGKRMVAGYKDDLDKAQAHYDEICGDE